jgi:hypothetical protein
MKFERRLVLRLKSPEALSRLSARLGDQIIGRVDEARFEVLLKKPMRNSWSPVLSGLVESLADGCILSFSVEEKWFLSVLDFLGLACGLFWITVFSLFALPSATVPLPMKILGVLVWAGVMGGRFGIRWFARRLARGEADELRRFVDELYADVKVTG